MSVVLRKKLCFVFFLTAQRIILKRAGLICFSKQSALCQAFGSMWRRQRREVELNQDVAHSQGPLGPTCLVRGWWSVL